MSSTYSDRTIDDSANDWVEPLILEAELLADETLDAFGLTFSGVQIIGRKNQPAAVLVFHFEDEQEEITQAVKDAIDAVLAAHAGERNVYTKTVDDSLNDLVNTESLRDEVLADETVIASGLTFAGPELRGASDDPASTVRFVFVASDVVTSGVKTALDAVLAAHTGVPTVTPRHLTGRLLADSVAVVDNAWTAYGHPFVVRPGKLTDIAKVVGVVRGVATVDDGDSQVAGLRLVERLADGTGAVVLATHGYSDTVGVGVSFEFDTTGNTLRAGLNQYFLEAQLDGAVSLQLDGVSLDLFALP